MDKDAEIKLYEDLAEIEGFDDYLRAVMENDIKLYFNAIPEQQGYVKGAHARTKDMLAKLLKAREKNTKAKVD